MLYQQYLLISNNMNIFEIMRIVHTCINIHMGNIKDIILIYWNYFIGSAKVQQSSN